jgi:hypothetical protein
MVISVDILLDIEPLISTTSPPTTTMSTELTSSTVQSTSIPGTPNLDTGPKYHNNMYMENGGKEHFTSGSLPLLVINSLLES